MNRMAAALDDIESDVLELSQFVGIYKAGVESPQRMKDMAKPLLTLVRKMPAARESVEKTIAALERTEGEYRRIVGPDLSYMFGLATVRLWSVFEATMGDLCRARLEHGGFWKAPNILKGLRIELHEFVPAGDEGQVAMVFDALADKTKSKFQPGAGRFENLLGALGLGGPVPREVSERLVWLSTSRHCLVHRQGKIDARVFETLPGAGKLGEKLVVREHEFARAVAGVRAYAMVVGMRLQEDGLIEFHPGLHRELKRLLDEMEVHDKKILAQRRDDPKSEC